MHKNLSEILITREQIEKRVREIASDITRDYHGKEIFFIGVLKGCFIFLSDLIKNVKLDTNVDFMMISSYDGKQSSGIVRILLDLKQPIDGKDVIVVEDIVDTGLTINYLIKTLKTRRPKTIEVCTLLNKPSCRKINVNLKYVGFNIPDKFVVGYGLDYNEYYRNLPYIGVLKHEVS
jgi:hypoxanthine phosphoribosyltransferase